MAISCPPTTAIKFDEQLTLAQVARGLDQTDKPFQNPYIIFYPVTSRDDARFPVNRMIRSIQQNNFKREKAWRGNIVVAKYRDPAYSAMMDMSVGDYALLSNYLLNCPAP